MNAEKSSGKWYYDKCTEPFQYGELDSYQISAEWLNVCSVVEDWGCGCAFSKRFFSTKYIGIDGSASKWGDVVADLTEYKSQVEGILIRHVLEHNYDWRIILKNAVESFTKRMVLVMFIEPGEYDVVLNPSVPVPYGDKTVPDLICCEKDIFSLMSPFVNRTIRLHKTNEILYMLEK